MAETINIVNHKDIEDIETIYYLIQKMNKSFISMENCFFITFDEMRKFYVDNYFFLAKLFPSNKSTIHGFVLYFTEFNQNYGWGIYLDDLFVVEEHRGEGLGKMQMKYIAKFCKENDLKFIKLIYQNLNINHLKMYEHFGFKDSGMQLMEIFGKSSMKKFESLFDNSQKDIIKYLEEFKLTITKFEKIQNTGFVWSVILNTENSYYFNIQTSYNCWLGPIVLLNNFNGNLTGVRSRDIWTVLMCFLQENPINFGIWADINDSNLEIILEEICFVNITKEEYWNILVLDENGIERLL